MNPINLNDSSFDSKDVVIFNEGVAGIVENVSMKAEEKKADDKESAPNLRVIFVDPNNNAEINFGLWNVSGSSKDPDKDLTSLGRTVKHIFHSIYGAAFTIPAFRDDVDMINAVKTAIDRTSTNRYRVAVNYGSGDYPSVYLRVKKFVPFMENMNISKVDSKLALGTKDFLHPIKADDDTTTTNAAPKTSWVAESTVEDKPAF